MPKLLTIQSFWRETRDLKEGGMMRKKEMRGTSSLIDRIAGRFEVNVKSSMIDLPSGRTISTKLGFKASNHWQLERVRKVEEMLLELY